MGGIGRMGRMGRTGRGACGHAAVRGPQRGSRVGVQVAAKQSRRRRISVSSRWGWGLPRRQCKEDGQDRRLS